MSSGQTPSPPSSHRADERPTLPPIREVFPELNQAIRPPSRVAFSGSHPVPEDPRRYAPSSPAPGQWGGASSSQLQRPQGYPAPSSSHYPPSASHHAPGAHGRPGQYTVPGHARMPLYGQQTPEGMSSGTYPYPGSYAPAQAIPLPGPSTLPPGSASGERPSRYECSYCGRGFTRPSSLRIHINTHTGERPYTCPFPGCGRSFSVQSNMRRHSRVHTRTDAAPGEGDELEGGTEESDGHETQTEE